MLITNNLKVKKTKIRNSILASEYNSDLVFTKLFVEENKSGKLDPWEVREGAFSMSLDKFLDRFNYAEEDVI